MGKYIDGFVLPLKKDRVESYRQLAESAAAIWIEHGALEYHEFLGDDLAATDMVPFPQLANCADDETVVFAWAVFESREHRDATNAKIMADPRLKDMMTPSKQVIDCHRMAYGGFTSLVDR
ncbi:DUF1428 domain-containing protein [soil metagenome]